MALTALALFDAIRSVADPSLVAWMDGRRRALIPIIQRAIDQVQPAFDERREVVPGVWMYFLGKSAGGFGIPMPYQIVRALPGQSGITGPSMVFQPASGDPPMVLGADGIRHMATRRGDQDPWRFMADVFPDPIERQRVIDEMAKKGKRARAIKDQEEREKREKIRREADSRGWWWYADIREEEIPDARFAGTKLRYHVNDAEIIRRYLLEVGGLPRKSYRLTGKTGRLNVNAPKGAREFSKEARQVFRDLLGTDLSSSWETIEVDHHEDQSNYQSDYFHAAGPRVPTKHEPALRAIMKDVIAKDVGKLLAAEMGDTSVDYRPEESIPEDHYALNPRGRLDALARKTAENAIVSGWENDAKDQAEAESMARFFCDDPWALREMSSQDHLRDLSEKDLREVVRRAAQILKGSALNPRDRQAQRAAQEEYDRVMDPTWDAYSKGIMGYAEYIQIKNEAEAKLRHQLKEAER